MTKTLAIAVVVLLFALGAPSAWAGWDEGMAAYKRGDYATALREFRPLANQGDVRAENGLGVMYRHGRGVTQDYGQAVKWFRKAAAQGDACAQYNLGLVYDKSHGVYRAFGATFTSFTERAST